MRSKDHHNRQSFEYKLITEAFVFREWEKIREHTETPCNKLGHKTGHVTGITLECCCLILYV
jgi:hypothetical protein